MRIALVKPDHGIIGGFELVLREIIRWLRMQEHELQVVSVRADISPEDALGVRVSRQLQRRAPEFVRHISLLAAFRRLELTRADLVLSTQPPSYAVTHARHLSLFYHHNRWFYDLLDLAGPAGVAADVPLHSELASIVRAADDECFEGVRAFLVPSRTVATRLREFNGIERILPFQAAAVSQPGSGRRGSRRHILCVSRHEIPKRTELFIEAAQQFGGWPAVCVGDGSRRVAVQQRNVQVGGPVHFINRAPADELDELYMDAACVVAPAYDEDYGLTALEAMAHGVPIVVCADGGGLSELVEDAGCGIVVPPDATAIADATRKIAGDPALAEAFGDAGRSASESFTWDRAFAQITAAIDDVMR